MTRLLTGSTGGIGSRVTSALLARGERPRLFVRDTDKTRALFGDRVELFVGDLADPSSLAPALVGVDQLLLINDGPELARRDEAAATLAARAGVHHLVKLSSMASLETGERAALGEWHARGEAAVRASGLAHTFVQPTGFMSNALGWETSIRATGAVFASTGDGRIAMIHPDDVAAVLIAALTSGEHEGASLAITGPEALSYAEMTRAIGSALGRPLELRRLTDAQARERMLGTGMPPALVDALVSLWRSVREGRAATVTDTVERVLGRPPIPFDRWVEENADAFR